ncbi:MAG: ATP-binding protein [Flexilinea sp.]|nr:ATP-binding protein [Flexilinea sp.]
MKLIERTLYLKELEEVMGTPDIKVITGVRRCGKSKLLEAFIDRINQIDPDANIIHINYNLTDFEDIREYHALERYAEERYEQDSSNYILIDEIQMCPSFELAVNSLHAKEKYDIYVTGSNAFLQSSDLATLFVGRTYEIHIFPFSFREYLQYYPSESIYGSFSKYLTEGGMAGSYLYKNETQKFRYINSEVLNALVVRDIVRKYKIRNEQMLHKLIDFLMDNIGNKTSIQSINNVFASEKTPIDYKTTAKYIDYLCKSFAFYRIRGYDIKGKKYLRSEDKYYLVDHSFKYARLGTKNMDFGRVLENAVAIELLRRDFEVYIGVFKNAEVDFVAIKNGMKTYIQVAYDISESKNFNREISSLLQIPDAYPKILLARTYQPEWTYEGIRIIDAADWLNCTE